MHTRTCTHQIITQPHYTLSIGLVVEHPSKSDLLDIIVKKYDEGFAKMQENLAAVQKQNGDLVKKYDESFAKMQENLTAVQKQHGDLVKKYEDLVQQRDDFVQHNADALVNKTLAAAQQNDPDDLPELIFRISNDNNPDFWKDLLWVFILSFMIQVFQIRIAFYLMDEVEDIADLKLFKWESVGLLKLDEEIAKKPLFDDVNLFESVREGKITVTNEGFRVALINIVFGLALMRLNQLGDITAIMENNQYHLDDATSDNKAWWRLYLGLFILLMQIVTDVVVTLVCSIKLVSSSLEISDTISSAIEAFFILQIDKELVPALLKFSKFEGIFVIRIWHVYSIFFYD